MKSWLGYGCPIAVLIFAAVVMRPSYADPTIRPLAEKPYFTVFAASIDKVLAACAVVLETVERTDLSNSLSERLDVDNRLSGIDKSKPLGVMSTWDDATPETIIFLPVGQIDELLKTSTFGSVGFHQVAPDHYEIERPDFPYHVLVQKGFALFADSTSTIRALRLTPIQLTEGLRERYDFAINLDFLQIPRPTREKAVSEIRKKLEPWLQPQDDEVRESANLRKSLGKLILDSVERGILDTKSLIVGVKLDPHSKHLVVECTIDAVAKSSLATVLNRLIAQRAEFSSLVHPDVPASLAVNLPLGGLVEQIFGAKRDPSEKSSQMEAGLQLAGSGIGDFTIIAALSGPDADRINDGIPQLILKLEQLGEFLFVNENFGVHRGVVLHNLTPRELPALATEWLGKDLEIIIGQGKQTVWMGIGPESTLIDRIEAAIDRIDEAPTARERGQLVRARFQARKLPAVVASAPLIPNSDANATREELERGEDGFSLMIEPVTDGLKLRLEAEEGFLRLFGRDWATRLDESQ